jgi:hypothetical protein
MKTLAGRVSVSFILIITALFPPGFLSAAAGPRNLTFGVYGAWALGQFGPLGGGRWREEFHLDHSLGAYIQYNISTMFSVQANVNYQHGRKDWGIFTYWSDKPHYVEGTDSFQLVSANLNAVLNESRWRASVFYVLAGCGITTGDWYEFSGTYINLTAGMGVKVFLTSSPPKLALNMGGTFVHLIDPQEYGTQTADYLKFQIGIEF